MGIIQNAANQALSVAGIFVRTSEIYKINAEKAAAKKDAKIQKNEREKRVLFDKRLSREEKEYEKAVIQADYAKAIYNINPKAKTAEEKFTTAQKASNLMQAATEAEEERIKQEIEIQEQQSFMSQLSAEQTEAFRQLDPEEQYDLIMGNDPSQVPTSTRPVTKAPSKPEDVAAQKAEEALIREQKRIGAMSAQKLINSGEYEFTEEEKDGTK